MKKKKSVPEPLSCPRCEQPGYAPGASFHWCGDPKKQCERCGKDIHNACVNCFRPGWNGQMVLHYIPGFECAACGKPLSGKVIVHCHICKKNVTPLTFNCPDNPKAPFCPKCKMRLDTGEKWVPFCPKCDKFARKDGTCPKCGTRLWLNLKEIKEDDVEGIKKTAPEGVKALHTQKPVKLSSDPVYCSKCKKRDAYHSTWSGVGIIYCPNCDLSTPKYPPLKKSKNEWTCPYCKVINTPGAHTVSNGINYCYACKSGVFADNNSPAIKPKEDKKPQPAGGKVVRWCERCEVEAVKFPAGMNCPKCKISIHLMDKFIPKESELIEEVSSKEWDQFQRFKNSLTELEELAREALSNWKHHLQFLQEEYSMFDKDIDDLDEPLCNLPRLLKFIKTGHTPPKDMDDEDLDYYDDDFINTPSRQATPQRPTKVKVCITDISTGDL